MIEIFPAVWRRDFAIDEVRALAVANLVERVHFLGSELSRFFDHGSGKIRVYFPQNVAIGPIREFACRFERQHDVVEGERVGHGQSPSDWPMQLVGAPVCDIDVVARMAEGTLPPCKPLDANVSPPCKVIANIRKDLSSGIMTQRATHHEMANNLDAALAEGVRLLRTGHLVGFPTETVYGLGADARDGAAVARIYETKGRPSFNPLIVHVSDRGAAERLAMFCRDACVLADAFWPGPLTLVLPARPDNGISSLVSAGLETLAIRVPAHPMARDLLEACECPVAAPSANRSGRISPTRASHVRDELGDAVPLILDGGASAGGLESTIVDVSGDEAVLLRSGTISRSELEAVLGTSLSSVTVDPDAQPVAPGQLASHYAPAATVRLDATSTRSGEALLGFGAPLPAVDGPSINLSTSGDLREAAACLFDALRELDATGVKTIAVMPIPDSGIGEAINDRLRRAAAPRS